ncbi:MAG TPA: transglutaminase domain-containing protein [Chitinophagaceae bacterium]|nr:transglutaminase domain-containing protein [Chitinophagaceae bacterium]
METNNKTKLFEDFFYHMLAVLCIVPLAPMINRVIPPVMIGNFNADLFVAILMALAFVRIVLWLFKPLIIPSFVMIALVMLFNTYANTYTVSGMVTDYKNLVTINWENRMKKDKNLFLVKPSLFDTEVEKAVKGMKAQMNFKDSTVRNFAVKYSTAYFEDEYKNYGPTVRYLSLFKHINHNFKYVQDPLKKEYYATPMETIENGMAGDCDDHTILMISALNCIGAKTRMVLTEDHVYPELYCGDKKSFLRLQSAIIDLFPQENFSGLYYREENGEYWINLDYSAHHPGGPYVNNKAYAVVEF